MMPSGVRKLKHHPISSSSPNTPQFEWAGAPGLIGNWEYFGILLKSTFATSDSLLFAYCTGLVRAQATLLEKPALHRARGICKTNYLGVGGAERQVLGVPYARIELAFFSGHWPICGNRAEVAAPIHARGHAVDFEILEPLLVRLHADRIGAVLGLAVLLPTFSRFQDVTVGIDGAGIFQLVNILLDSCHFFACFDSI
jgi:hypothetical protein